MAQGTVTRQAYALINLYSKEYEKKHGAPPASLNRYRDKWGFHDMIEHLGYDEAKELVLFYFQTARPGHPLQWLLYNYEALAKVRRELLQDESNRQKIREQTRRRVEEWREKHGNG